MKSDQVTPLSGEEIACLNNWKDVGNFNANVLWSRVRATLDARDAEIQRLSKELADMKRYYRKPTHGPCCTCQRCGQHYDDCRCDLDEAADEIASLKADVERLTKERDEATNKAARKCAEAVCEGCAINLPVVSPVAHDYGKDGSHQCDACQIRRAFPKAFKGPMPEYAYCETVAAYVWHIRRLSVNGLKPCGGADTLALCGAQAAWDIANVPVDQSKPSWLDACRHCRKAFEEGR